MVSQDANRFRVGLLVLCIFFQTDCIASPNSYTESSQQLVQADAFDHFLALRWAPVHYQATTARDEGPEADFLTTWDYDSDLSPANNWDHFTSNYADKTRGHAYYTVVESCTHWFVTYLFYHARDWNAGFGFDSEHENDTEGLLAIVRKDGSRFGTFEAMITRFHGDLYTYTAPPSSLVAGQEPLTGTVFLQTVDGLPADIEGHGTQHPKTHQEAEGHGVTACCSAGQFSGGLHQDGVVYIPSNAKIVEPPLLVKQQRREARYNLSPLLPLWSLQLTEARLPKDQRVVFLRGAC